LLYKICNNFADVDLHPDVVPDRVMSNLYEHLIRRFGAEVNEGAEDFMTPRDVVHLATALILDPDDALFEANPGLIRTLYDPTCGTGGFLSDAMSHVEEYGSRYDVPPVLVPHGQELEPETHAVCLTGMLLRTLESDPGRDLSQNIKLGSTLSNDQFSGDRFHYGLSNPPFGKKWEKDKKDVEREHKDKGLNGRFGPGLPRVSDGSMLFLLHLTSKLELPENGGGRAAIVLSGSPLFNGGAGSGESEIRRYLLENDLVEAIVALPTEIFFRTGIGTYLWILSNKKSKGRKGQLQLINATGLWTSIKNEGNKRRIISDDQRREILDIYAAAEDGEISKMLDYRTFGYRRITVERPLKLRFEITEEKTEAFKASKHFPLMEEKNPDLAAALDKILSRFNKVYVNREEFIKDLKQFAKNEGVTSMGTAFIKQIWMAFSERDEEADTCTDRSGNPEPDTSLRDFENVPLSESIYDYFAREVLPHVPDAWIDEKKVDKLDGEVGIVGYEINFNRFFYKYAPPRPLEDIDAELKQVEGEIADLLNEVAS